MMFSWNFGILGGGGNSEKSFYFTSEFVFRKDLNYSDVANIMNFVKWMFWCSNSMHFAKWRSLDFPTFQIIKFFYVKHLLMRLVPHFQVQLADKLEDVESLGRSHVKIEGLGSLRYISLLPMDIFNQITYQDQISYFRYLGKFIVFCIWAPSYPFGYLNVPVS